jgi:glycosyltransferase involved in cell wall biosynthesis
MALFSFRPSQISPALHAELVVVVPIYNEAANIEKVTADWVSAFEKLQIRYRILLINDGSTDGTLDVLKRFQEKNPEGLVVVDKFNSGHGRSCRFGYDATADSEAEWVLQIDSDGQCNPDHFEEFWKARLQADCVFGIRTRRDDGWVRTFTSKVCRWSSTLICGVDMADPNVPYRLIRKTALAAAIKTIPSAFEIHNVAVTYRLKQNSEVRWAYVPIRFLERQGGVNSINLVNVLKLGVDLMFDLWRLRRAGSSS